MTLVEGYAQINKVSEQIDELLNERVLTGLDGLERFRQSEHGLKRPKQEHTDEHDRKESDRVACHPADHHVHRCLFERSQGNIPRAHANQSCALFGIGHIGDSSICVAYWWRIFLLLLGAH